jgi:hypothetical protein
MDPETTMLVVALATALCGCASQPWQRPGATLEQLTRDEAQCAYEADLATSAGTGTVVVARPATAFAASVVGGIATGVRAATLRAECMQARGWQR